MNKNKYFDIREDISISNKLSEQIDALRVIIETYREAETMTLKEVKNYLSDRKVYFELKIQQEMEVE